MSCMARSRFRFAMRIHRDRCHTKFWHRCCSDDAMASPEIRLEHRQHQTLTPRLQHAVRLLQLSSLDFAQEVQEAMGKNPFLEVDESADTPAAGDDGGNAAATATTAATVETV